MNLRSVAFAATVLCLLLSSCGKHAPSSRRSASPTPPPGRKLRLAVVADSRSRLELAARAGYNRAAAELPNVALDFQYSTDPDAATQKRIVDDLLARSTDGIAISPVDPEGQVGMLTQTSRQTLLFIQNDDVPGSGRTCFVGTDRVAAGRQLGAVVRELLPEGGHVLALTSPVGHLATRERLDGLRQSLGGSKVELTEAAADAQDIPRVLATHTEVSCFVTLSQGGGPALVRAMHEANPNSSAKIVCSDAELETLQGVGDGTVTASVVEQPFEIGRQTIMLMNRALNGDRSAIPPEGAVFVPCKVLRRDSVDAYAATLQGMTTK